LNADTVRGAMLYQMFEDLRPRLSAYDALAVVDWERVRVATGGSFERLYDEAFPPAEGEMTFWVKGSSASSLVAESTRQQQESSGADASGPIDGSVAIYNNRDPELAEYLAHARALWGLHEPFEEAMWRTLSDFPGGRPPSGKFIGCNLVSGGGAEDVFCA